MYEDSCGFNIPMISVIAFEKNKTLDNTFNNSPDLLLLNGFSFLTISFDQCINMKDGRLEFQFEYFS